MDVLFSRCPGIFLPRVVSSFAERREPLYPRPMSSLQAAIERRGQRIFELVDQHPESIFSKAGFYQKMMAFSMRDEAFKVQMFRFVDVLASLRRSDDIVEHLREYFHGMDGFVPMMQTGLKAAGIFPWLTAFILRRNVSGMARQFIAGKDGADVMKTLRKKRRQNIGFTVDLLGEAVVSEKEANEYAARAMELLETLSRETRGWTDPLGKNTELFPVVNLSLKISAFYSQMDPAAPEEAIAHLAPKLRPILRRAKEVGAFVNFDMESYAQKNSTLDLFKQLFTEDEFVDWPRVGIVVQAYLRDAERDLRDLIDWGRRRGTRFAVRLVKGAYWDYEKIVSSQNTWLCPVFLQKPESDACFESCTRILLDNESIVTAAFGSHNVRSIAHAMAYADEIGVDKSRFEFQLLYGMAGPIKRALVEMGYRVREYSPVGELLPGMSYLVRRLLENTSNEGFLRAKFSDNQSAAQLLRDPNELITTEKPAKLQPKQEQSAAGAGYENAPAVNFVHPQTQEQMRTALREARGRFGKKYPLVIGGEKVTTGKWMASLNPSAPSEIVGEVAEAGIPEAERAVKAASAAFGDWSRTSVEHRAQLLERVAAIMERRRFELAAVEVYEVGKAWEEADGDIREAMDFCLFYAQQMRLLGRPKLTQHVLGRRKLPALLAARCRARDRAVEFPDRDPLRHGLGGDCDRQHGHHEAGGAIVRHRRLVDGDIRRSGCAAGRAQLSAGPRLRHRAASGRSPRGRDDRVYRLARSWPAHLGISRQDAPRPARIEARRLRDGRQERHHRRFRRRPRRDDRRLDLFRLWLPGPEMFRALPAHRA